MDKNNKLSRSLMTKKYDTIFDNISPSEIPIHFICLIKVFIRNGEIIDLRPDRFHDNVKDTILNEISHDEVVEDIKVLIDVDKLAWHVDYSVNQIFSKVFPE